MKRGCALALSLLLCLPALWAAGESYVFRSAGFRYTERAGDTVLTATNLEKHADLLAQLGTDAAAVQAGYAAAGIVMEVFPEDGGQISVSVAPAGAEAQEMDGLDAAAREALADRFRDSGLYEECGWAEGMPSWLRLASSAMYGSLAVHQVRYLTLHLGHFYTVCGTVVGREPDARDEAGIRSVIENIRLLSLMVTPTPAPTATPAPTPAPTATPEPPPAETRIVSGSIALADLPSVVQEPDLTVSGMAAPRARVRVSEGEKLLGTAAADQAGSFALRIRFASEGEHVLTVTADDAEAEVRIQYVYPEAKLTVTEPADPVFTGERILIRGVTEPNATVYATGERISTNVKANRNGVFTVPIFMDSPGTRTYTLHVRVRGMSEAVREVTLTRVPTEREELAAFKEHQVNVSYAELAADPAAYAGKNFVFRGKVMDFIDYDGNPTALICVGNPQTGVWQDPLYAVLSVGDAVQEGDVITFYLVGEGLTLPADGRYTRDGQPAEAPTAVVFRYAAAR